uniref:Uncharacterized protein n=1 Tax=Hippocampus comes TaxID=109280 RepID=A0A3Q2Y857_HIPCM
DAVISRHLDFKFFLPSTFNPPNPIMTPTPLTSMCSRVKTTGSLMKTRLDSLLIEAAMMSELTDRLLAFSVLRNCPKFL